MGAGTTKNKSFFSRLSEAARYVFKAGRYDNATNNYPGLWRGASLESFDQGADHSTRQTLRARARYTAVNNAFAQNAAKVLSSATIGTGARLQLTSDNVTSEELTRIEADFSLWAEEVGLSEKLRAMVSSRFIDGEAFAQFCLNNKLRSPVKLDLMLFDADRVTSTLTLAPLRDQWTDGIKLGPTGDPVSYRVLKEHPSEGFNSEAVEIPAGRVVHLFRKQFPEQHRGVTELQPALDLFLLLDRYTKAAVVAAETAADLSMVFHTDTVADFGAEPSGRPFYEIPWRKGTTVTLPEGWDASQVKAEQPTGTYNAFVSSLLNQIGAAVGVPKILIQGSAENSNYSSARLDLQVFTAQNKIDRDQIVTRLLAPLFRLWLKQYAQVKGRSFDVTARFYFDQFVTIDPVKEAQAAQVRLASNVSNLSLEYARAGLDWEEQLNQRARELELIKRLKLGDVTPWNNSTQEGNQ